MSPRTNKKLDKTTQTQTLKSRKIETLSTREDLGSFTDGLKLNINVAIDPVANDKKVNREKPSKKGEKNLKTQMKPTRQIVKLHIDPNESQFSKLTNVKAKSAFKRVPKKISLASPDNHLKKICSDLNSMKTIKTPIVYESTPLSVLPSKSRAVRLSSQKNKTETNNSTPKKISRINLDDYLKMSRKVVLSGKESNERVMVKVKNPTTTSSPKTSSSSSQPENTTNYDEIELYMVPMSCTGFQSPQFMELNQFILRNLKN